MLAVYLLLVIIFLANRSESIEDSTYQIQPQSVCINNFDELYITSDDHFIGQVLYRYDQLQLACDCQTLVNHIAYKIYWTINNKTYNEYNDSNRIQLIVDINTVRAPVTFVACHCIFIESNRTKTERNYEYKLLIDLESEPSLKPIAYTVELSMVKQKFQDFIHLHFAVILSFIFVLIATICPLMILNSTHFIKYLISD
ncbi:unnamed protein product [Rotaria magnacalcarata]|uniref:Uncharacterized protein n=1 Tax=Rotaria magnacalcarata TaxID=392030 RepID=A0A816UHC7_9BILA|nr:unnamed protein product [Rotaria magnacalcarata]CAF1550550.1 unnamed protein product [Rotaria magnacalcarata]CAF2102364.1 unnamed protein product [Rotaria magnacalcarata]